jgi:hypothetical protein
LCGAWNYSLSEGKYFEEELATDGTQIKHGFQSAADDSASQEFNHDKQFLLFATSALFAPWR